MRRYGNRDCIPGKTRFSELLDRVVQGEEIVITRHGKAAARLVPEGGANLAHTRQAVADLRAGRSLTGKRRGFKPLTDREIKEAIAEVPGQLRCPARVAWMPCLTRTLSQRNSTRSA